MTVNKQSTKDPLAIMTVHEVAEYLRISRTKVYRLVKAKQIPVARIGKNWRFRRDLLDNWLSQRMEPGVQADGRE